MVADEPLVQDYLNANKTPPAEWAWMDVRYKLPGVVVAFMGRGWTNVEDVTMRFVFDAATEVACVRRASQLVGWRGVGEEKGGWGVESSMVGTIHGKHFTRSVGVYNTSKCVVFAGRLH